MIQVLHRADAVLAILSRGESQSLGEIAAQGSLRKTTLSNILKTLVALGYARRDEPGRYSLGDRMRELLRPSLMERSLREAAAETTQRLSLDTGETTVATIWDGNAAQMIAQAAQEQALTINPDAFRRFSPYGTASGRVLIAHLAVEELRAFADRHGLPGPEWEGVDGWDSLLATCRAIREQGFAYKESWSGQVAAMAVPVTDQAGRVRFALGLNLPMVRFQGGHRATVERAIREAGAAASRLVVLTTVT